jgi:hypothetical protein
MKLILALSMTFGKLCPCALVMGNLGVRRAYTNHGGQC